KHSLKEKLFFVSLPRVTVRTILDSSDIGVIIEDLVDSADPQPLKRLRKAAGILPTRRLGRWWRKDLKKIVDSSGSVLEPIVGIQEGNTNPNTTVPSKNAATLLEDKHVQNSLIIFATIKDRWRSKLLLRGSLFVGRIYFWLFPPWG